MARIDVRIKTSLPATVQYHSRDKNRSESIIIEELSLSGALVSGLTTELKELFSIRVALPPYGEITLQGKVVRPAPKAAAIRLYPFEKDTIEALWGFIRRCLALSDVCLYCGHKNSPTAVRCQRCNMYLKFYNDHYLEKHIEYTFSQRLSIRLSKLNLEHFQKIIQFVDSKLLKMQHKSPGKEFVAYSPPMLAVFSMIRKVAPTEMNVLVLGESGTGKELTAKALHTLGPRPAGPFVAVNCAAIPESLLEAELFGHEKGAFTGADSARKGKFESADGGTLFLDEIGDLPHNLQAKLLRFLEDRVIEKIGGRSQLKINVRVVAATNSDLEAAIENGTFRSDLYYRLNCFTIKLPALRDRGEDVVLLARHFLSVMKKDEVGPIDFSQDALAAMRLHRWPGNVRELHNKVKRGFIMASGELIDAAAMELDQDTIIRRQDWVSNEVSLQCEAITAALQQNNYIIARAARQLNISRQTLYAQMRKHGIDNKSRHSLAY